MNNKFLNDAINTENLILPDSDKINPCIKKNCESEIVKAIKFLASDDTMLQIHGYIGTGKRQFINYLEEFIDKSVIKLEYYCKASTVCDDILLTFLSKLEELSVSKQITFNAKITTLNIKFQQHIMTIKSPILIILHTADDIEEANVKLIHNMLNKLQDVKNVKIIISTRALLTELTDDFDSLRKIFIKAFPMEIFKEYIALNKFSCSDKQLEDFYDCTHGYYYYIALSLKIGQAMKLTINDFLVKFKESGMKLEEFLCNMYLNLLPPAIRNFFWFLKTIRHGISLNALALLDIYDDFSIEFLKSNLMIFQVDEVLYVQDLFYQKADISIPDKIQVRLHRYIIGIYEKQLKLNLNERLIYISRQSLRAEIEYHNSCIDNLLHKEDVIAENKENPVNTDIPVATENVANERVKQELSIDAVIEQAKLDIKDKNITQAIEVLKEYVNKDNISIQTVVEIRMMLANLYKKIADYSKSSYYYDLVETYYKQANELINLNYLYYDLADLYYKMYKKERATEILKKVIYSVETPVSLLINACISLGNIYSDDNNLDEASAYYCKALESVNSNTDAISLCELYFKYALVNDDKEDMATAFEYYNKCIAVGGENVYKASAYSNMASCYYERESYSDALDCFMKAYNIEKNNNNYEGIFYNATHIAEIYTKENSKDALKYLKEAKQSAEFINDNLYILNSSLALGDFYYNRADKHREALREYFTALKLAKQMPDECDIHKIERRINDMKMRMTETEFQEIECKYAE